MYHVYILQSQKDKRTYVGYTGDIRKRLNEHNSGRVKSTKHRIPFRLLLTEQFDNAGEAKRREKWWKSSSGRRKLKEIFDSGHPDRMQVGLEIS